MKKTLITMLVAFACASPALAQLPVNLTPAPAVMTVGKGDVTLPKTFTVGVDKAFGDSIMTEASRFAAALSKAMDGYTISAANTTKGAFIHITPDKKLGPEAYTLDVSRSKITVKAATADGVYYALQSLKKIDRKSVV